MVAYSTGVPRTILCTAPAIFGWLTSKGLWDTQLVLLEKLRKIKHPDHPTEGMTGMMMIPVTFSLISTRILELPD